MKVSSSFISTCLVVPGHNASALGMAAYIRDGYGAFRQPKFECGCCEILVFRVSGVRQIFYLFSLYRNPYIDDQIYMCLLTSMAAVRSDDVRTSFLFAGALNSHRQAATSVTPYQPFIYSAINTLLAIRYSSVLLTCPNHLDTH